jgi:hypothetical protein
MEIGQSIGYPDAQAPDKDSLTSPCLKAGALHSNGKVCERVDELPMQRFSQNLLCAVCDAYDESDR